MTENELRQKVAEIITGWEGSKRGSVGHYDILNAYNGYQPLARGYAVKPTDAWCAATVSATWIRAGIAQYTGTECSCSRLIEIAKAKGWWVESDTYVPKIGDAVLYDWDDGLDYAGKDNTGAPEHIGLVIKTGMGAFTVMEGNKNGAVGRREMVVGGRFIRGFYCPDYAEIAKALTPGVEFPDVDNGAWYADAVKWAAHNGIIKGYTDGTFRPAETVNRAEVAVMLKRLVDMLKGE